MKVDIGPYIYFYGPFQIAEKILFFLPKVKDKHGLETDHPWVRNLGNFLAYGSFKPDGISMNRDDRTWFSDFCEWMHRKRKRKVKIRVDRYDHWNAHNTISMIALPILKDLKKAKHSFALIADEDAPEELRSNKAPVTEEDYGWDANAEARYAWVLDEIIWALEQDQPDCDWEDAYTFEQAEIDLNEYPEDAGKTCIPVRWKKEGKYDWDGRAKHQKRIDNGFRLFGKYYQSLWS